MMATFTVKFNNNCKNVTPSLPPTNSINLLCTRLLIFTRLGSGLPAILEVVSTLTWTWSIRHNPLRSSPCLLNNTTSILSLPTTCYRAHDWPWALENTLNLLTFIFFGETCWNSSSLTASYRHNLLHVLVYPVACHGGRW